MNLMRIGSVVTEAGGLVVKSRSRLVFSSWRRHFSDKKYESIEEFNRQKKTYSFGQNFESSYQVDGESSGDQPGEKQRRKLTTKYGSSLYSLVNSSNPAKNRDYGAYDINSMIENDPRLEDLTPGSSEYRETLSVIHEEYSKRDKRENARLEMRERLKALGIGLALILSIIGAHLGITNYEYYKTKLFHSAYKLDDTKIKSLDDPAKNTKTIEYLANKFSEEIKGIETGLTLLKQASGLYLFGFNNSKKIPVRLNFFDGMLITDVQIKDKYVAVVDEKGNLYEFVEGMVQPTKTDINQKLQKCQISNDMVYLLTKKGEVLFKPRLDKVRETFEPSYSRNYLGIKSKNAYNKVCFPKIDLNPTNCLNRSENIKDISIGESHILMLTSSGRLFVAATQDTAKSTNYGQFGLPRMSPISKESTQTPFNQGFELTNLNNELLRNDDGSRQLRPRKFTSIASGRFHNLAADDMGNVWTWGKNAYGECGSELTYKSDIQPLPKMILSGKTIKDLTQNAFIDKDKYQNFEVKRVFAGEETSYVQAECSDSSLKNKTDLVFSFGNGMKGQLGVNRFLHVCHRPQLIKSLANLNEYDEKAQLVVTIGIKDISVGDNHAFVTLNNSGTHKDVLCFGDNEFGQLGNGKIVRSSKPGQLPKIIEPEDVTGIGEAQGKKLLKQLAKKVFDPTTERLQLMDDVKLLNGGSKVQQVIVAGDNGSAIYYRRK